MWPDFECGSTTKDENGNQRFISVSSGVCGGGRKEGKTRDSVNIKRILF